MKYKSLLITLYFLGFSITPYAAQNVTCQITVSKSAAWNNYDLAITMNAISDLTNESQTIMKFDLPKASAKGSPINSITKSFDCHQYYKFNFTATFTPALWMNAQGKPQGNVFNSLKIWDITNQIKFPQPGVSTLDIQVNFPDDFGAAANPSLQ